MAGTALVLGGGGLTGIGWEIGVLAGLADAGLDLADADVVIGTSAGSIVGAHLTSRHLGLDEMYAHQLAVPENGSAARMGPAALARFAAIALRSRDTVSFGVRMGRLALAARTVTEAEQRTAIARTLNLTDWPARRLVITAVDAATGSGPPSTTRAGCGCSTRWARAARSPESIRRSPSTAPGGSTAGCTPAPTPIWPPDTTGW
ncbi:hypothetical protein HOK021_42650 [Streptomyces hygroscopicus]|nr:hypothetical protein HOK021_42650 [Streptomyces hygroscopicus]